MATSMRPAQKSLLFRRPNGIEVDLGRCYRRAWPGPQGLHSKFAAPRSPLSRGRAVERLPLTPAQAGVQTGSRLSRARTRSAGTRAPSLGLDAAFLHHPLPFAHFLLDEGAELGRAHPHHLGPFARELLLDLLRGLHLLDRLVQPLDDRR